MNHIKKHRYKYVFLLLILIIIVIASLFIFAPKDKSSTSKKTQVPKNTTTPRENTTTPQEIAPKLDNEALTFNKQELSLDDPASIWVVANKRRPLQPKSYTPTDLVSTGNGQQLRAEAAQALAELIGSARTQNLYIKPLSGYRSYTRQVQVYNNEVARYGQAVADTQSARPGTSEHQTGLSIDVGGGGCGIEDCFGSTNEGKWLAENAYRFGFIIRYPEQKQDITGYRYEPWHIRYVGVKLATEMRNQNILTLEEFFNLPPAPNYES